jgi:hypothetical protein
MKPTSILGLFLLSPLFTACVVPAESRADDDDVIEPRMGSVEDEVCPIDRYIARRIVAGPCPSIGTTSNHWAGEKLFGDDATGILGRYCLYEWEGTGDPSAGAITTLDTHAAFEKVASDCEGISREADVLTDTLQLKLRDIFRLGVGRATAKDLGITALNDPREPVTVAVIDTAPPLEEPPVPDRSKHGESMARIIEDIACPGGYPGCAVEVQRVLGMPRWEGGYDELHGGVAGGFSDVSRAIVDTVRAWAAENAASNEDSHLVLNLSLGWEPPIFGGEEPNWMNMDATPAAVYNALEFASCMGVIVVVAAGNDRGVCTDGGPLNPGGWETRPAPTTTRCQNAFGISNPVVDNGAYRPLVYAVGGGGLFDGLMPETREGSLPRLIAPATHVVAGDDPIPPVTGTSVAAAAVSAAAANVWAHNPSLLPSAVMTLIYNQGELVPGYTSEFRLVDTLPASVRRVDVCEAVERACQLPGATGCNLANPLPCLNDPSPPTAADLAAELADLDVGETIDPGFSGAAELCGAVCSGNEDFDLIVANGEAATCPVATDDPLLHITRPQPDTIGCPACTINGYTVSYAVHECFETYDIENISVILEFESHRDEAFAFGPRDLAYQQPNQLLLDAARVYSDMTGASIEIKLAGRDAPLRDPLIRL